MLPSNKTDDNLGEQITSTATVPETVTDLSFTSPLSNGMGTYTYTGPVDSDHRPHGIGTAIMKNGDRYEGPFEHGIMEGKEAKYLFKASGDRFEGEMRQDQMWNGTYTFGEDGSFFKGSFSNNQPDKGSWYEKGVVPPAPAE
jgi:hypothetical protein